MYDLDISFPSSLSFPVLLISAHAINLPGRLGKCDLQCGTCNMAPINNPQISPKCPLWLGLTASANINIATCSEPF